MINCDEGRSLRAEELIPRLQGVQAVIAAEERYTREVFERAPMLRIIARDGVGLDSIDLEEATRHNVVVTNAPVVHEAVADLAMGLILSVVRKISTGEKGMRSGKWAQRERYLSPDVSGACLGLVGFGAVGKALARRASGFAMRIIAYDTNPNLMAAESLGVRLVDLDTVLAEADVVSLHVPLLESTRKLINAERLARMKRGAFLINTSRGSVVDEAALTKRSPSAGLGEQVWTFSLWSRRRPITRSAAGKCGGNAARRKRYLRHVPKSVRDGGERSLSVLQRQASRPRRQPRSARRQRGVAMMRPERISLLTQWFSRRNERPVLGFFLDSMYPLHRYLGSRRHLSDGLVQPGDIFVEDYLEDCDRLFKLHEDAGGDLVWSASPFFGMPWVEASLGCGVVADFTTGSTRSLPPLGFESSRQIPSFSEANPWVEKLLEFIPKLNAHSQGRYPVGVTLMRGISDLLSALYGGEGFVLRMMEDPDDITASVQRLTDYWIQFGRCLLNKVPFFLGGTGSFFYSLWTPGKTIWLQEDAAALLSPDLYEKFILPADVRIARAFEHTVIHLHPARFIPVDYLLETTVDVIELHFDKGGPSAQQLLDVHRRHTRAKASLRVRRTGARRSGLHARKSSVEGARDERRRPFRRGGAQGVESFHGRDGAGA